MDYTQQLVYRSDYWYNDGLRRANIRDLSGAVASLKRSLQYNRENVVARNLLGLVYYGRGEVAEALVQWIISKNLKSYENIANYYIKKVEETPGELDAVNQAVRKYNQCLVYCRQNGEDLAIIQLKKVVAEQPNFLKAQQLLALLYLHTGQYARARQVLHRARRLDVTNEITLRYLHELSLVRGKKVEKLREEREHTVTYNLGNETIIQPASASLKDNAALLTIVNIAIGILVGAAVVWFLIAPAVSQRESQVANKSVISLSEQIAAQDAQIEELRRELEGYRTTSDQTESALATAQSTQTSYEQLMIVYDQYTGGNTSNADMLEGLLQVEPEALGERAKLIYEEISSYLFPVMCKRLYGEAQEAVGAGEYASAVTSLEKVIRMEEGYDSGAALKLLGDAYAGAGNAEKAEETYKRVVDGYPDTDAAEAAKTALGQAGTSGGDGAGDAGDEGGADTDGGETDPDAEE